MKAIGVRELKAHLSQVLKDVQAGEDVLVTDRGRVIAELRRPGATALASTPVDRALARMAAEGTMRIGEPHANAYPVSPLKSPAGTAGRMLDELREDRL
ncbi:MAG: type II toxin-antitoxin system prevent-host-death family antitoxin [Gemmatimonadota bacterium]|nr:type II toxin-antitoxin system prevent-host-death family antitoxin [Gemmatimonadota bacterium]